MTRRQARTPESNRPRSGSALIIVLIVLVILTLSAYTFSEFMIAETEAVSLAGREVQTRAAAESALEYVASQLGNRLAPGEENLYHNPALFQSVVVQPGSTPNSQTYFTIVAPIGSVDQPRGVRYGLIDESSKLNLNAIAALGLDEDQERTLLMSLPGMTESVADAILDWIDADDQRRPYGAESIEYQSQTPPYAPRNGNLESLDELLLVTGVTPQLLYGEDANRNGLLDPNENDGDVSLPVDNEDGVLQLGWDAYLTVESCETNLRSDGGTKIDVNQSILTELYDQLSETLGEDYADFIVAYRMEGAVNVEVTDGAAVATTGDNETDNALQQFAEGIARQMARGQAGTVTRGGMDLSTGGPVRLTSLYELVDAEVEVAKDGSSTTLKSPWNSSNGDFAESLITLFDTLSVSTKTTIIGRVNVNQAKLETLLGLPEMDESLANSIVGAQWAAGPDAISEQQLLSRATTGWLLTEGLTDVATLRKLDKYLTARGDVYRATAIGHFGSGGPLVRLEAIVNASVQPPAVTFRRDLSHLGSGYRLHELIGQSGP